MREQSSFMKDQQGPLRDSQGQELHHFGNYEFLRRIAVGGMGEVYLARQHSAFGREVAVTIIRSDLVHDTTARRRFLREAEVSAYLKHDYILPLVEFGEEQGRLFLVTPYVKGGTLGQRLEAGALPLPEVYRLFTALVEAVSYLHKRGVIHRDLKPSNILLDQQEHSGRLQVRLIDFGIASMDGDLVNTAQLTNAGQEVGTVAYMAPERLDGIVGPSNDIYSLGVILYQMLTGQLFTPGQPLIPLPRPLATIIQGCLAPDPAQRFESADTLLNTFEDAYVAMQRGRTNSNGPTSRPERTLRTNTVQSSEDQEIFNEPVFVEEDQPPAFKQRLSSPSHPAIPRVNNRPSGSRPVRSEKRNQPGFEESENLEDDETARLREKPASPDSTIIARSPRQRNRSSRPIRRIARPESEGEEPAIQQTPPLPLSDEARIPTQRNTIEQRIRRASLSDTATSAYSRPDYQSRSELRARLEQQSRPELRSRPDIVLPPLPEKEAGIIDLDIDPDAPTSSLDVRKLKNRWRPKIAPSTTPSQGTQPKTRQSRKSRIPLIAMITACSFVIIILIAGVSYVAFQSAIEANITLMPRTQTISNVFTITAKPGLKSSDLHSASIPANVYTETKTATQEGQTTGTSDCVLGVINCKQSVSLSDVSTLASQIRPGLQTQIDQDLQKKARDNNATPIGKTIYSNDAVTSDPQINAQSKTVKVTVSEQGSLEYVQSQDARKMAQDLLKSQLPAHYTLLDQVTRIGQPVFQQINADGSVKIAIAAATVAQYQIPESEITDIQNHIKGKTIKEARTIISKHPNIDTRVLSVRLSVGNNLPDNTRQIKVQTINPDSIPTVQLTPVATPAGT